MALPTSKQGLADWVLRRLGAPVINIEISDEQLEDVIDESLQFYREYHFDGTDKVYRTIQITPELVAANTRQPLQIGDADDYIIRDYTSGDRVLVDGRGYVALQDLPLLVFDPARLAGYVTGERISFNGMIFQTLVDIPGAIPGTPEIPFSGGTRLNLAPTNGNAVLAFNYTAPNADGSYLRTTSITQGTGDTFDVTETVNGPDAPGATITNDTAANTVTLDLDVNSTFVIQDYDVVAAPSTGVTYSYPNTAATTAATFGTPTYQTITYTNTTGTSITGEAPSAYTLNPAASIGDRITLIKSVDTTTTPPTETTISDGTSLVSSTTTTAVTLAGSDYVFLNELININSNPTVNLSYTITNPNNIDLVNNTLEITEVGQGSLTPISHFTQTSTGFDLTTAGANFLASSSTQLRAVVTSGADVTYVLKIEPQVTASTAGPGRLLINLIDTVNSANSTLLDQTTDITNITANGFDVNVSIGANQEIRVTEYSATPLQYIVVHRTPNQPFVAAGPITPIPNPVFGTSYGNVSTPVEDTDGWQERTALLAAAAGSSSQNITFEETGQVGIRIPENIISVSKVFKFDAFTASGIYSYDYQFFLNNFDFFYSGHGAGGGALTSYYIQRTYIEFIEHMLNPQPSIRFNKHKNRLFIDTDWRRVERGRENQNFLLECYEVADPEIYGDVYSDSWLKRYAVALAKRQWGSNLKKYEGTQLPGGITVNGQVMYDEGNNDAITLEEELKLSLQLEMDGILIG